MAVPTVMSDLSTTAASNSPAGSESPTAGDDFLRAIQAIVRTTNAKGSDIASATSTAIGAATGEFVDVTGTTTITSFDTIAAGIVRTIRFTGALTLTHNATSLILPGSANITTANGDVAQFRSLGSGNWKCVGFLAQAGRALGPFIDSAPIVSGSADATKLVRIEADGLTTATTRVWTAPDKDLKVAGIVDLRSYLAGCTLSTAGSSATMSIAAGTAVDSTNVSGMQLAAIAKTTSAWAVGTAQGGLDAGSIANSTWYHFYVIQRTDTGVVDVVFSTNATSPTMPTNYTLFRRIGSGLTNGSAQWVNFTQNGDDFNWLTPVLDVSALATSATAALATLSVPLGVKVKAYFNSSINTTIGNNNVYFSDPAVTDQAASTTAAPLASCAGNSSQNTCYTNTSSQIRHRENNTTGNIYIATLGWTDSRGRNA